jgi:hypothetical protein
MTTHREQILTGAVRRGVDGLGGTMGQPPPLHMSPAVVHHVQLWHGFRQEAQLEAQLLRRAEAFRGQMRRAPVLEQHDVPPAPMGADHGQERLMRFLAPRLGAPPEPLATAHGEPPRAHASGMRPRDRHAYLLADAPLAGIKRWGFRDNGLIEHQEDRPFPSGQAALEPPFACRHVAGRRARSCRGRFHRRRRRAISQLTLGRETAR